MSARLRVILIILLIVLVYLLAKQVVKKRSDIRYTLPWLLLIAVLGILVIFPEMLYYITGLVGVALPINLLFLSGIIFSLTIIYVLTSTVSKLDREVKDLSQELALLEKRLRENSKNDQ